MEATNPTPETDAAEAEFMKTPARAHPYERLLVLARRLERERDAALKLYVTAANAAHDVKL